jgi:hypothetical protein
METLHSNADDVWGIADLFALAARELGAFRTAVSDLFGAEQARLATEDWLVELESSNVLPGFSPAVWRPITILAATRLAMRRKANQTNTKVSAIPSSNCSP